MAMNQSEKKKIKYDAKKIGRILCFALLTIALIIGIVFSSVKVNLDMIYGPEYNGAYQASVQILKDGKAIGDQSNIKLSDVADSLQGKLAPFSDKSLTISKQGTQHLNVIVGKQDYENSESYLRDQIESNGGMFVLAGAPGDTLNEGTLADYYLTAKDATSGSKRFTNSDFFTSDISTKTLSNGAGRNPYVKLGLKMADGNNSLLAKALQDESKQPANNGLNQAAQPMSLIDSSSLYFVTDLEEMVNQLRYFYEVNDNEEATKVYFENIIKPVAKMYNNADDAKKTVLADLFGGTVNWTINGSPIPQSTKISLINYSKGNFSGSTVDLDKDWTNNYDAFKTVLKHFTPNTSEMPTSTFLYSADAKIDETNKEFSSWLQPSKKIKKSDAFKVVINTFMSNSILFDDKGSSKITPSIKKELTRWDPQLSNYVLFNGPILPSTTAAGITTSITSVVSSDNSFIVDNANDLKQDSSGVENAFYLRTKNLTAAKKTVASIKQNALGVGYLVESITDVNPYITSVMYIVSVVFLSLIALLLAAYVLYAYRLLGLFTIIIAACAVAITLLAAVGFGIGMGPQVIAALFLIISLILDSNFIVFEGFKRNYYEKKHGIVSSFKIGNKETLTTAIDTLLVAFIPNIVLFWAGQGPLKTFGTLSIIGIALAVVCGIIIGRFIYWLILKAKFVQENDWLLPIDTRYTFVETLRDEFAINKYSNYLENHEGKTKYTSKELMAIQNAKEKLEEAKKSYHKHLLISNAKTAKKDEKTVASIKKNTDLLTKFKNWFIKTFKVKKAETNVIVKAIDAQIDDNNFILDVDKEADTSDTANKSALRDKGNIVRKNRFVNRGTFFLSIALVIIGIIAAIVGGTAGVSWSRNVGYGQQFVVYGDQINNMHDKLDNGFNLSNQDQNKKWNEIKNSYENDDFKNLSGDSDKVAKQKQYVYACEIKDFLEYLDKTDGFNKIGQTSYTKQINLKSVKFAVEQNYQHVDKDGTTTKRNDMVAIRVDSNATNEKSRSTFKRLLVAMATGTKWPNAADMSTGQYNSDNGGIAAYDLAPYTISKDIKNVGIAFGIAIAVLVAYILIRFKWTYYVALALGLGLTIGAVVALIVIFQVPMSSEMLCGMVFVISFALTSIILVLGRGKSQLNLTNKETIEKNFSGVVELAAKIRAKKAETKAVYAPIKKKMKQLRKEMLEVKKEIKHTGDGVEELEKLTAKYEELKNDYKAKKKEQVSIYKKFKYETKQKENELQRKNWYFKSLFSSLIKYSAWRMATLGVFYLLVGVILAATLPSIFSMGLTIIFGIIVAFAIALFVSVPVWVYFEKRRIRYVYGRKKYIKSLKVSREEEIVKGIND